MSIYDQMIRRAYAPNVSFTSADEVDKIIRDAGHGDLLDNTDRYTRQGWAGDENNGIQGMYGHQAVGVGVNNPKKYAAEAHRFYDNETDEYVTVIITYQLTENGQRDTSVKPDVQVFRSKDSTEDVQKLNGYYKLKDGTLVDFDSRSFDDAVDNAKQKIDKRDRSLTS